jgi:signal transduction histidine kinase
MDWLAFRLWTATIAACACFSLAILSYVKQKSKRLNRVFALFNLFLGFWNLSDVAIVSADTVSTALFFDRLSYVWGTLVVPLFFYICAEIAEIKFKNIWNKIIKIATPILIIIAFTPWFITDVKITPYLQEIPGPLYVLFIIYLLTLFSYGLYLVFRSYRSAIGLRKNQIKYVFLALFFAFLAAGFYFAVMIDPTVPQIFYIPEMLYTAIMAYVILRYQIMDINLVFRYATIYSLLTPLPGALFAVIIWFYSHNIFLALIGFFSPLAGYFFISKQKPKASDFVDKLPAFKKYQGRMDRLQLVEESIAGARTVEECAENTVNAFRDYFLAKSANVLIHQPDKNRYLIKAGIGLDPARRIALAVYADSALVKRLESSRFFLNRDSLSAETTEENQEILEEMEYANAQITIPLFVQRKLTGMINIGAKETGEMYNDLDLNDMTILSKTVEATIRALMLEMYQMRYVSQWAHDLMRPFTKGGVMVFLKSLLQGNYGALTNQQRERIEIVTDELAFPAEFIPKLVNPMAAFEKTSYKMEPQSLKKLYEKMADQFRDMMKEKNIEFITAVPPEELLVICDSMLLEHRVLLNLLDNALRYTPSGGKIELGYKIEGDQFIGYVKDTGIGIPNEMQGKIFEAGVQLETENKGTAGLGLANVKEVIEAHKGRIWLESQEGQDSTFYFSLKLAREENHP